MFAMARRLTLRRRWASDDLKIPSMVEPMTSFARCDLRRSHVASDHSQANYVHLLQPKHRLGHGDDVGIAGVPLQPLAGCFRPVAGVMDRDTLRQPIPAVKEAVTKVYRSLVQFPLGRVERQVGTKLVRQAPVHDAPRIDVNVERDLDELGRCSRKVQVRQPQRVRAHTLEQPMPPILGAPRCRHHQNLDPPTPHNEEEIRPGHQPRHHASAHFAALIVEPGPYNWVPVNPTISLQGSVQFRVVSITSFCKSGRNR